MAQCIYELRICGAVHLFLFTPTKNATLIPAFVYRKSQRIQLLFFMHVLITQLELTQRYVYRLQYTQKL